MDIKKSKRAILLQEVFDSLFIMIICFATLLTAMLLKGGTMESAAYNVDFPSLASAVLVFGVYLFFIIRKSDKELKDIMADRYKK